jgi:hypothetical protein
MATQSPAPHKKLKLRAHNDGPQSRVAKQRQYLYRDAIRRVNHAMAAGFYLEAITILESMISDRLESRLSKIHRDNHEKRKFSNLSPLAQELAGIKTSECDEAKWVYNQIIRWADRRNASVHEMAKLLEGCDKSWDVKYKEVKQAALEGKRIFRMLDLVVRDLNKHGALRDSTVASLMEKYPSTS